MRNPSDIDEDYTPAATAAGSAEPFRRPNHKAKKHGRPAPNARNGEKIGGGHLVFRRGDHGRIHPGQWPFEHASAGDALAEASRLTKLTSDTFEVFSRVALLGGYA